MRRALYAVIALIVAGVALPGVSHAQSGRDRNEQQRENDRADAARRGDDEWTMRQGRLDGQVNAGPCPYVKILYDAARYVELRDNRATPSAVGFTGEIEGVEADCRYREADPIEIEMEILFHLGRGPQAEGDSRTYRYWVAVTERNSAILAKQYFDLPVSFEPGEDRTMVRERLEGITIPRSDIAVSGSSFEVLVGFEVTPEMAEFNRAGARFRIDAGTQPGQ